MGDGERMRIGTSTWTAGGIIHSKFFIIGT